MGEFVEVSNDSKTDPCAWLGCIGSVGADKCLVRRGRIRSRRRRWQAVPAWPDSSSSRVFACVSLHAQSAERVCALLLLLLLAARSTTPSTTRRQSTSRCGGNPVQRQQLQAAAASSNKSSISSDSSRHSVAAGATISMMFPARSSSTLGQQPTCHRRRRSCRPLLRASQLRLLRRARVWDDQAWRLIELGQKWEPGEVRVMRQTRADACSNHSWSINSSRVANQGPRQGCCCCPAGAMRQLQPRRRAPDVAATDAAVAASAAACCAAMLAQVTSPIELELVEEKEYFRQLKAVRAARVWRGKTVLCQRLQQQQAVAVSSRPQSSSSSAHVPSSRGAC